MNRAQMKPDATPFAVSDEEQNYTDTLHLTPHRLEPEQTTADILTLITQLCGGIDLHTHTNDRDILCFCLHHLFLSIEALSRMLCRAFSEEISSAETQSASIWQMKQHRATWTYLREIKQALERVEPLCQLLNDASYAILISLATSTASVPLQTIPTIPDTSFAIHLYCEQFLSALTPRLNGWLQCLVQPATFRYRFAHLFSATPTLLQIDNTISRLLKCACSLFRDTLPELSTAQQEEITALLLDLMQKVDLMLQQIDMIMVPLHTLSKQFALGAEMR
ncbi:hypothetical protein KSF_044570 [Reticulibacter mediterranei]|uniref:Uncharacterized protein n=1 Tax=Reticulibacter mediterranei TaxID=2778369 RepID=A0A8J3IFI0_9CHLR|nr:hypothetical protein [Reticulibacter mediterranei]GHO94409.1 hypothetical protein KSF_044570 [Reticulibacter mediterranei]